MASSSFDTLTNVVTDLSGEILEVTVLDPDLDPNHVLQNDQEWFVKVRWEVKGLVAPGLGGDWNIRVNLESMGEGFEGTLQKLIVPVSAVAPNLTRTYETTITMPKPETIPNLIPETYKLIVAITHTNTGGGITKRTRMAGFYEGPLLEFVDPEV